MEPEEFRRHGHAFVDWMADYLAGVEDYPVMSPVKPGEITAKLALSAPDKGQPMEQIFADFQTQVMPGITHWQHPSFFAYFPANSSPPAVLAEMLVATIAPQCMLWQTSPAATEMETRVLDWLRQMIGLPQGFDGVIQDSASSAMLCALLTARERVTGWQGNETGLMGLAPLCVYVSEQVHSAADKDVMVAGMGLKYLRKIPVDENFAMRPDALAAAIEADIAAGHTPCCVIATLGTTGVGAVDPLRPIGEICQRHVIYLHVDAAWAGSALVLPAWRWMIEGIEAVDSFAFNPHKWLFTPFDLSAFYCRRMDRLRQAFALTPEYLQSRESEPVRNLMDTGVQLGRRFRALKLWMVLRHFGADGIRHRLAEHMRLARLFGDWVDASDRFERLAPVPFSVVCFRATDASMADDPAGLDDLNARLLDGVNATGDVFLSHTRLGGRFVLRLAVGHIRTTERHVARAWNLLQEQLAALLT